MECPIDFERFDQENHKPKILHCGHTVCLQCLRQVDKCPVCRRDFAGSADELPTNFALLALMDEIVSPSSAPSAPPLVGSPDDDSREDKEYCFTCDRAPTEACRAAPHIIDLWDRVQKQFHSTVLECRKAKAELLDTQRRVVEGLTMLVPSVVQAFTSMVERATEHQSQMEEDIRNLDDFMQEVAQLEGGVNPESVQKMTTVVQKFQSELTENELAAALLEGGRGGALCELELESETDELLNAHRAMVQLEDKSGAANALRLILYMLAARGHSEQRQGQQQDEQREAAQPQADGGQQSQAAAAVVAADSTPTRIAAGAIASSVSCSRNGPSSYRAQKAELLQGVRQRGARRLDDLWCHKDPEWALELLRAAAPTLEVLQVMEPDEDHLRALHSAPRLERLELKLGCTAGADPDESLPALPVPTRPRKLEWLRVECLPRAPLESMLRTHKGSLRELWLRVGTPGGAKKPDYCDDLPALLRRCGLAGLRLLVLQRGQSYGDSARYHNESRCTEQKRAAAAELADGGQVLCLGCDKPAYASL